MSLRQKIHGFYNLAYNSKTISFWFQKTTRASNSMGIGGTKAEIQLE